MNRWTLLSIPPTCLFAVSLAAGPVAAAEGGAPGRLLTQSVLLYGGGAIVVLLLVVIGYRLYRTRQQEPNRLR